MKRGQVKTQKKVRRRLNIKRVFILALIIGLIFYGCSELLKVNVENIVVSGNDYVSSSTIIKKAGLTNSVSYISFSSKEVCSKVSELSLINTCKVKRGFDWKITIEVTENKPLFYYLPQKQLALSSGKFIEEANTYGVPTLINSVPEEILKEFTSGLSDIKSDIIRSISEIEYTPSTNNNGTYIDEERFMLSMNDGNIVYINNRHLSVLNSYTKIYASIGDKKGYYNFDCDFNNYYFKAFDE